MEEFLRVGVITKPHGVHGEIVVFPTTEDPKRFEDLETIFLKRNKSREMEVLTITGVKYFKNTVILNTKEINDMDAAGLLRQCELYVDRQHAIPLEEGEYFIGDLIGLQVVTDEGQELGELKDILETGANQVFEVKGEEKDILIPVIDDCFKDVDFEKGEILVHILPGLLDL